LKENNSISVNPCQLRLNLAAQVAIQAARRNMTESPCSLRFSLAPLKKISEFSARDFLNAVLSLAEWFPDGDQLARSPTAVLEMVP